MESLKQAVQTPTAYLLLSGLIMVLTLWFSKSIGYKLPLTLAAATAEASKNSLFIFCSAGLWCVLGPLPLQSIKSNNASFLAGRH